MAPRYLATCSRAKIIAALMTASDRTSPHGRSLGRILSGRMRARSVATSSRVLDDSGFAAAYGFHGFRENRGENQPSGNRFQCPSVAVSTGLSGRGLVAANGLSAPTGQ